MRKKIIKKISVIMAVVSVICSVSACKKDSINVNNEVPTFSEEDVIYRSAWWCPEPTEENYELYQECGLNTLFLVNHNYRSQWDSLPGVDEKSAEQLTYENAYFIGHSDRYEGVTQTDEALKLCKDMGLYVYLAQGDMYFEWIGSDLKAYDNLTFDYDEYKDNIIGLFAGDEPSKPAIYELAQDIEDAENALPSVPYFANLHPSYAHERIILEADSYEDYVKTYCEEFLGKLSGPRLLSVDYYPFQNDYMYKFAYSYNQLIEYAKQYNAKFHTFIQIQEEESYWVQTVTEQDVRFQVNTALAYGATQYSYFLYDTAGSKEEIGYLGLVDLDGKPTERYNYAKTVNCEVETLEHALLHYNHEWTTPYSDADDMHIYLTMLAEDWEERLEQCRVLRKVSADNCILISLFKDEDGNEAYYVVNYYQEGQDNPGEVSKITLEFDSMQNVTLFGSKNLYEGEVKALKNHQFSIELEPGDGIFIVPSVLN